MTRRGYCHVYTGDGKGKTTAAFGLALRAAMCEKKVYIGQFVKGMQYSETKVSKLVSNIVIEQYGDQCFITQSPTEADCERARLGLKKIEKILQSNEWDLVVLDEITIALFYKLLTESEVLEVLRHRNPEVEVVVTGRYCPDSIMNYADLVTEMKEIKHYYSQGVLSREGFDC